MKIIFRLILLVALVALGWWLWTVFFPSPEKVIRQRMARLAQTATFTTKDSVIVRALKAQKLVNFFSPDAQVILDSAGYGSRSFSNRDEITETANAAFASIPGLKVDFLDVTVSLATDRQSADVSCTGKVRFGDNKDYGVQEMHFLFKKVDGVWLIVRAETVKTLS